MIYSSTIEVEAPLVQPDMLPVVAMVVEVQEGGQGGAGRLPGMAR